MRAAVASAMRQATQPTPPTKVRTVAKATSAKTTFMGSSVALGLQLGRLFVGHALETPLDHLFFHRTYVVDEKLVVQVIVFVLQRPRVESLGLGHKRLTLEVGGAHPSFERAFDRDVDSGKR